MGRPWGGSGETILSTFHVKSRTDTTQSICTGTFQQQPPYAVEARQLQPDSDGNYEHRVQAVRLDGKCFT